MNEHDIKHVRVMNAMWEVLRKLDLWILHKDVVSLVEFEVHCKSLFRCCGCKND